ncbi:HAD-IC family P-type ATPase [Methylococcus geothermalis]|uniref:HAD-IC family P-type ATPase n=1 Tax=Methylococcus geothermalis TaxID=2681310 RepID=A0A858Q9T1_9GAMM|nr:HAD-IC family P-type ATPase [Methylococcus geothermalis]
MNHAPVYGLWGLVIANSAVFILFAFSFFKPRTALDWRSFGAFSAFLVALFTEMYGFPLTIYLLSGWLSLHYPDIDLLSHEAGHLWHTLLGLHGDPHFDLLHILSMALIAGGFWLLASAWPVLYAAQRSGTLAITGPYARLRHPQYAAFILIMLGFLLQWPTLPTLAMFPVLVSMYQRLARREEQEALVRFGARYARYKARTPAFIPHPGRRTQTDRNTRGTEQAGKASRLETWHDRLIEDITAQLGADFTHGLASEEARRRLLEQGRNELSKGRSVSALAILAGQFKSLVIWILIGAASVSIGLGEWSDGIAILAIVILNAIIGFFQEYRAEKAAAALARLAAPKARVIRGGHATVVAAAEIVRGDILLLEAGDLVAADARLVEASVLQANEASLTGESQPVEKRVAMLPKETPLADRRNMIFLGTNIVNGSGRALVVATGMDTEVGHIARLLQTARADETPLRHRLDRVGRRLLWICLGIVAVVFGLGLLRSNEPFELFLNAVSLAVAAIPEGLPAVVTVALALGVQRMVRRNALVRRLPSVETLGCAQVICTDKTGTLTVGAMTARKIVTQERLFSVTGEGYHPIGSFICEGREQRDDPALSALLWAAVACNDAELTVRDGRSEIVGDPTEGALLVAAAKWGINRAAVEIEMPRLAALPFDSDRKRMTVIRRWEEDKSAEKPICTPSAQGVRYREVPHEPRAFVKGAPEVILELCTFIQTKEGVRPMTAEDRVAMIHASKLLASDALRVLAIAERVLESFPDRPPDSIVEAEIEQGLTLLGLVGLQDPPRGEVREAVAKCKRAGIKTVMITGDHPATAQAIAHELGILDRGDEVVLGAELERMSDGELLERVRKVAVYARVTAEHKLRIVRAWKATGRMEGDRRRRGDDGRWRQRRPSAQGGVDRHRHGHRRHRGDQGNRRPHHHGRQFRLHRRGGRGRTGHLRQYRQDAGLSARRQCRGACGHAHRSNGGLAASSSAATPALDQPGDRWAARTGVGNRSRRSRCAGPTAAQSAGRFARPGFSQADLADRLADRQRLPGRVRLRVDYRRQSRAGARRRLHRPHHRRAVAGLRRPQQSPNRLATGIIYQSAPVSDRGSEFCPATGDSSYPRATSPIRHRADNALSMRGLVRPGLCPATDPGSA